MKKRTIALFIIVLIASIFLCGCENQGTQVDDDNKFISNEVKMTDYKIEYLKDSNGDIGRVTIEGNIENIINENYDLVLIGKYYDAIDNYLGESKFTIRGIREKGSGEKPNPAYKTSFILNFKDPNADKFDHFIITTEKQ